VSAASDVLVAVVAVVLVVTACSTPQPPVAPTLGSTEPTTSPPATASNRRPADQSPAERSPVPTIRIAIANRTLTADVSDNPTARDLIDRLPLTMTFRDFNRVEKVGELARPLTMDGVPAGDDPEINDIGYYAPSRSLVLYYGDVGYWDGIVRLGRLTPSDMALIERQPDGFEVTIDRG
jgi:hypothetical protein